MSDTRSLVQQVKDTEEQASCNRGSGKLFNSECLYIEFHHAENARYASIGCPWTQRATMVCSNPLNQIAVGRHHRQWLQVQLTHL
jgi:hypothetical protein